VSVLRCASDMLVYVGLVTAPVARIVDHAAGLARRTGTSTVTDIEAAAKETAAGTEIGM
jgi:predicted GIY-YIG superfamily endonuclease